MSAKGTSRRSCQLSVGYQEDVVSNGCVWTTILIAGRCPTPFMLLRMHDMHDMYDMHDMHPMHDNTIEHFELCYTLSAAFQNRQEILFLCFVRP